MIDNYKQRLQRYKQHRYSAALRGIPWQFTYIQWAMIWAKSGHWYERGRKRGQYVMARFKDKGPYSPDNVKICTVEENRYEMKLSAETLAKMSVAKMGNKNRLGKKFSAEAKAKISSSNMGKKLSVEHKAKISASRMGKKHSTKTRNKISASQMGNENRLGKKLNII